MNAPVTLPPSMLDRLIAALGENRVKTDQDSRMTWGKDWTKHFEPNPSVIVFPSNTDEVQQVVQLANEFGVVVTPSGGRTGLSAGAVAANGEIVVSLDRMKKILDFLPADRMVRMQAGVVTEQLQQFAEEQGLYYPNEYDPAFTPIISSHDKGESAKDGALLIAPYGKGYYIYTGLSFFRELPEGVIGAYRLMANLISY